MKLSLTRRFRRINFEGSAYRSCDDNYVVITGENIMCLQGKPQPKLFLTFMIPIRPQSTSRNNPRLQRIPRPELFLTRTFRLIDSQLHFHRVEKNASTKSCAATLPRVPTTATLTEGVCTFFFLFFFSSSFILLFSFPSCFVPFASRANISIQT